jgi:hypothetical protein
MNYAYIYVNKLQGDERLDLYGQLAKSIEVLKDKEKSHGSIHIYSDIGDQTAAELAKKEGCFNRPICLSRKYSDNDSLIDILAEKIIQLKDFNNNQEVTLLDVDTLFLNSIPNDYWTLDTAVLWKAEYYITQFRNLDKVLPLIPWHEIDINFDSSFVMYNTGVVYIPKLHRKEICEKALWITDYLNNGTFKPEDRHGNKLDEQIGLSIAMHDMYGKYGKVKHCNHFIHHYWEEKTKGLKWW